MKILFILVSMIWSTAISAQQTTIINDANVKSRTLNAPFSAVSVSDGISLYLTAGTAESIAVSASDEKYEAKFKTQVENGVLKIFYDNNGINYSDNSRRRLKAYVSYKTLERILASGGASVNLPMAITLPELEMKFTSGSSFTGELKAAEISLEQNSGSEMNLRGSVDKLFIDVSSGAVFKGYELTASYCDAKATSGGLIHISVGKELSARANSGGAIHYKGDAVIKIIDINSGGAVKKS